MPRHTRKIQKIKSDQISYVTVACCDDYEMAEEYRDTLTANSIPAVIKQIMDEDIGTASYAVQVPEEHTDEANNLIESQDMGDKLYDFGYEDEDEDYYNNLLDDDNY